MINVLYSFLNTSLVLDVSSSLKVGKQINVYSLLIQNKSIPFYPISSIWASRQLRSLALESANKTLTLLGRQNLPSYVGKVFDVGVVSLALASFYLPRLALKAPIEGRPYSEPKRLNFLKELRNGLGEEKSQLTQLLDTEIISCRAAMKERSQTIGVRGACFLYDLLAPAGIVTVVLASLVAIYQKQKYAQVSGLALIALGYLPSFGKIRQVVEWVPTVLGLLQPASLIVKISSLFGRQVVSFVFRYLLKYSFNLIKPENKEGFSRFVSQLNHNQLTSSEALRSAIVGLKKLHSSR